MKEIPKTKWQEIYFGLKLLKFYSESITNKKIEILRNEYNSFNQRTYPNDGDNNSIDVFPNVMSFGYLILVRSNEYIEQFVIPIEPSFKNDLWEKIKLNFNINSFDELLDKYDIKIINDLLPINWAQEDDHIKLQRLIYHIRNSISHWRYELDNSKITFKDRKCKTCDDYFHIVLPMGQFLNFVIQIISTIHDYLIDNYTLK